jgi:hypothetical protein
MNNQGTVVTVTLTIARVQSTVAERMDDLRASIASSHLYIFFALDPVRPKPCMRIKSSIARAVDSGWN